MEHLQHEIVRKIVETLKLTERQVTNTIDLLDADNTVPFITRYRKERTGGLDEEQIRHIQTLVLELREVAERSAKILATLKESGKLTPELQEQIEKADSIKRLDELYAPFKSKKKTRADEAREMGLDPLAIAIWEGKLAEADLQRVASSCVGKHPQLTSPETVLAGAADIICARISQQAEMRDLVRNTAWRTGELRSELVKDAKDAETFKDYAGFKEDLTKAPPHRILALDRGESKKALRVHARWDEDLAKLRLAAALQLKTHRCRDFMLNCLDDALKRLINPSIEREVRRELSDKAQLHAIEVFCRNLRNLLLQPPLSQQRVLAIDPGFRTGCKVAALDEDGTLLASDVIYILKEGKAAENAQKLADLVKTHHSTVIAIGNGTASRETESLVADTIRDHQLDCQYIIVNEAGASIYSTCEAGREEFPELDATVRSTISIGRRLQDPLSELVKIEPQHIGVGMYQHDLSEKKLQQSLDAVVESCVNHVGVDLNRASVELLKHVSGLSRGMAKKLVAHRQEVGPYRNRTDLLSVSGFGEATFTQAAGFLKIDDGQEPLDATWIHPESYPVARKLLEKFALSDEVVRSGKIPEATRSVMTASKVPELARELQVDSYTAEQVLESLIRPGRDPRSDLPGPVFRSEILKFEDLKLGMSLTGVVSNVVDFGAFVDVGLKNDGLVHISQMSNNFVSSPYEENSVGDVIQVWIDKLDHDRQRIGLTMLPPQQE